MQPVLKPRRKVKTGEAGLRIRFLELKSDPKKMAPSKGRSENRNPEGNVNASYR